jgi:dihydrofolate reductase
MARIVFAEFLSLDGVMQAPGGPDEDRTGGFEHGGWQMPYFDDMAGKAIGEGMAQMGGFLLGRRTYEIFAAYWPNAPETEEPGRSILNKLPKYVASRTLDEPLGWQNSTLLRGDVAEEVAKLKQREGKDIQVWGSGELAQTLMQHGLVDEYLLMINPIVLGSGRRLFLEGLPKTPLELVDSQTTGTGVLILTYRPASEGA